MRSRTGSVRQNAKGKVVEPQLPAGVIPKGAPASPSSEWLQMIASAPPDVLAPSHGRSDSKSGGPPARQMHAGPGLDLLGADHHPSATSPSPVAVSGGYHSASSSVPIVDSICQGCLETIATVKDHEWWCPWWDTPEGKVAHPL